MNLAQRLHYLFLGNGLALWYIVRPFRDWREKRLIVRKQYSVLQPPSSSTQPSNLVCTLFEGHGECGGWADRLRGILSVYAECKRHGLPFRLFFSHPFKLELFLQPAEYDWTISPSQLCRDTRQVRIAVMRPLSDSEYTFHKQQRWMHDTFSGLAAKPFGQFHIYTNASTAYRDNFSQLFSELFRPTARLQQSLDRVRQAICRPYISVSMRFLSLLGDFEDTVDAGATLSQTEREELIARCLARIEALHLQYPQHCVLVNSDSHAMLSAAQTLDYVYTIPGNISHLDRCPDNIDMYSMFEKTFLDFFTISAADAVFLIKEHDKMRLSGFPYAAALIGNKPYKELSSI